MTEKKVCCGIFECPVCGQPWEIVEGEEYSGVLYWSCTICDHYELLNGYSFPVGGVP